MTAADAWNNRHGKNRCRNAEPGTYGHECGRPARWQATRQGRLAIFCDDCKRDGTEARYFSNWSPIDAEASQ
jgi:hypothetical protein